MFYSNDQKCLIIVKMLVRLKPKVKLVFLSVKDKKKYILIDCVVK